MNQELKAHWEQVYATKAPDSVSWYQPLPQKSLEIIQQLVPQEKSAAIIDIGGGDAFLAEALLAAGYTDVSVLDISAQGLARAQARMGPQADHVHWHCSNVLDFRPPQPYQLWHDRATLHFLTKPTDISSYVALAAEAVPTGGYLVLAPFAEDGPEKCSGLPVQRYSAQQLADTFAPHFAVMGVEAYTHTTPSGSQQRFLYAWLRRL